VIQNENYAKGKKTYFKRHTLMNNAYYETTAQFFSAVFSNINLFRILRHFITLINHFYTVKLPAYLQDKLKACDT